MRRTVSQSLVCLFVMLASAVSIHARATDAPIGDRLVLSINNQPYTQRQVEAYVAIRESLRGGDGPVALVEKGNWREALAFFAEETLILQEVERLGGLQVTGQAHHQYLSAIKARLGKDKGLRETVERLGLTEAEVAATMGNVLRIANFRSSKDKQAAVTSAGGGDRKEARAKWLVDLLERSVVRMYEGAEDYVRIEPTLGSRRHGHQQR